MVHLASDTLSPGDSSQDEELRARLEAWSGLNVTFDPAEGVVTWDHAHTDTLEATLEGFEEWVVEEVENDHAVLTLGPSPETTVEIYAVGLVRFLDVRGRFIFIDTVDDIDVTEAPFFRRRVINGSQTDWWIASTGTWDVSSSILTTEQGEDTAIFYDDRNKANWINATLRYDKSALMVGGTNIEKMLRVLEMGGWEEWKTDYDEIRDSALILDDFKGRELDKFGRGVDIGRRAGEPDAEYRLRLKGDILARDGNVPRTRMIALLHTLLDADPGDVAIEHNVDVSTGEFRPRYFKVVLSTDVFEDAGIDSPFDQQVTDVEEIITRASGAGIKGEVELLTSAEWNSSDWDSEDSLWGS